MALISDIKSTQWTFSISGNGDIVQGLDDIKQSVFLILTTEPGTTPLRKDFGCGAYLCLDLPANIGIPKMIKEIAVCLSKYEPRIESVKVSQVQNVEQSEFSISYKIKNTVSTDQVNVTYG